MATATPSASSATAMSMTPLRRCTEAGPISSGRNTPSPPPSIMAGPPMPMLALAVAMITSQQPSSDALPAKQWPETMADHRHQARQLAEMVECVEADEAAVVVVARPAAAAFGKQHERHAALLGDVDHAVGFPVIVHALGAGEHRVVVGQDRRAGGRIAEQVRR